MPELTGLKVERVSLVDKPATGETFLVVKRNQTQGGEIPMKDLREKLARFLPDGKLPEEVTKAELPNAVRKEITDGLLVMEKYVDEFPQDIRDAVGKLATAAVLNAVATESKAEETLTKSVAEASVAIRGAAAVLDQAFQALEGDAEPEKSEGDEGGEGAGETKPEGKGEPDESKAELAKAVKDLTDGMTKLGERIQKVEKAKGQRKSLSEGDDAAEGGDDEPKPIRKDKEGRIIHDWPSFGKGYEKEE